MSDVFIDENNFPYSFYLIPPLNENQTLIHQIQSHGGVVLEQMFDTIILADESTPIPADLEEAHIYDYKVIEDSINNGVLVPFSKYLIHIPMAVQTQQGQEQDQEQQEDIQEQKQEPVSQEQDEEQQFGDPYQLEIVDNVVASNKEWLEAVAPSMRYFDKDEDNILIEEVRKRPWYGLKGHVIYEEICHLKYFKDRLRTSHSLRERMRTLNFEIGYIYKADPMRKHRLLLNPDGSYLRTSIIKTKSRKFTADEDVILAKTVFRQLNFIEDRKGFEVVEIPTSFYNKYSLVYPNHSKESYRQRLKNFVVPFGIKNYIKYYIMCRLKGNTPLPTHLANSEWIKARKQFKNWTPSEDEENKDSFKLYYPDVPTEDSWILDNWELTEVAGEANVIFENTLSRNYEATTEKPLKEEHSKTLTAEEVESYLTATMEQIGSDDKELDDAEFQKQITEILGQPNNEEPREDGITEEEATELGNTQLQFEDEPTTTLPPFYLRISVNKGPPVKLFEITDKEEYKKTITELIANTANLKVKPLCLELAKHHVNEYYSLYLFQMCVNIRAFIAKCICHYVDTDGKELLVIQPGVWSWKSLEWLKSDDNDKKLAIERYHGEISSSHMLRDLDKRKTMEEQLEKRVLSS